MKTKLITTLASLGLASASHAQFAGINGGVLLGGGYLEDPGEGYAFLQLRGTFYEDDAIAHAANTVNPGRDIASMNTELLLNDLITVEQKLSRLDEERSKGGRSKQDIEAEKVKNAGFLV